jgi:hypothetical protein
MNPVVKVPQGGRRERSSAAPTRVRPTRCTDSAPAYLKSFVVNEHPPRPDGSITRAAGENLCSYSLGSSVSPRRVARLTPQGCWCPLNTRYRLTCALQVLQFGIWSSNKAILLLWPTDWAGWLKVAALGGHCDAVEDAQHSQYAILISALIPAYARSQLMTCDKIADIPVLGM